MGELIAEVSLDCSKTERAPGGIPLKGRERFTIAVPATFPHTHPDVVVRHRRWAGTPHVQWGRQICLYAAPSVEWVPADGLYGLVDRLVEWLRRAAIGDLDPEDQPLHPPVAYIRADSPLAVIRADVGNLGLPPRASGADPQHRFLYAVCEDRTSRIDLIGWGDLDTVVNSAMPRVVSPQGMPPIFLAVAAMIDGDLGFEFPSDVRGLLDGFDQAGVSRDDLFKEISQLAALNGILGSMQPHAATPFAVNVLISTPTRRSVTGEVRQHLVGWRLDELGPRIAELGAKPELKSEQWAELAADFEKLVKDWAGATRASWLHVMEARPEIVQRRDSGSASSWLIDKRVIVMGCGALGAPVAEACVRAGAAEVGVADKGLVSPGILVRQPYSDSDLGQNKAIALAARLNAIRIDTPVRPILGNVIDSVLNADGLAGVDLLVDATADAGVASALEASRARARESWPATISMVVGSTAQRGVVSVSPQGATGAGRDVLRRLMLSIRADRTGALADVANDIFPIEARTPPFRPEPGCSAPTFVGSHAEMQALAGQMLDIGLRELRRRPDSTASSAGIVRLGSETLPTAVCHRWGDDLLAQDAETRYEIRVSFDALAAIRSECRLGARERGPAVETGGLLLGAIDDACGCVWVDAATGPPRDSRLSEVYFEHGIQGVAEAVAVHRDKTGRASGYIGMWHAHPAGEAAPSDVDAASVATLVSSDPDAPRRVLMLIIGGERLTWDNWLAGTANPDVYARLMTHRALDEARIGRSTPPPARHLRSYWPGGWSLESGRGRLRRSSWLDRLQHRVRLRRSGRRVADRAR